MTSPVNSRNKNENLAPSPEAVIPPKPRNRKEKALDKLKKLRATMKPNGEKFNERMRKFKERIKPKGKKFNESMRNLGERIKPKGKKFNKRVEGLFSCMSLPKENKKEARQASKSGRKIKQETERQVKQETERQVKARKNSQSKIGFPKPGELFCCLRLPMNESDPVQFDQNNRELPQGSPRSNEPEIIQPKPSKWEKVEKAAQRMCCCCCCLRQPERDPMGFEQPSQSNRPHPRPRDPRVNEPEPINRPEGDSVAVEIKFPLPWANFPREKYKDWLSKRAVVAYQKSRFSYSNFKSIQLMAFFRKIPFFFSGDQTESYSEIKRSFYGFIRRVFLRQTLRGPINSLHVLKRTVSIPLHEGTFKTTFRPHRPVPQKSQQRLTKDPILTTRSSVQAVFKVGRRLRTRQVAKRRLGRNESIQSEGNFSSPGSRTDQQDSNKINKKEIFEWNTKSTQMEPDSFLVNLVERIIDPHAEFSRHEEVFPTPTFFLAAPDQPEESREIAPRSIHRDTNEALTDETLLEKCISSVKGKQGRVELGAMFQVLSEGLTQAFPPPKAQSIWPGFLFFIIPGMRSISAVLTNRLFGLTGPLRMQPEKSPGTVNISCVKSLKGGGAIVWDQKTGLIIVGRGDRFMPIFASRAGDYFRWIC